MYVEDEVFFGYFLVLSDNGLEFDLFEFGVVETYSVVGDEGAVGVRYTEIDVAAEFRGVAHLYFLNQIN